MYYQDIKETRNSFQRVFYQGLFSRWALKKMSTVAEIVHRFALATVLYSNTNYSKWTGTKIYDKRKLHTIKQVQLQQQPWCCRAFLNRVSYLASLISKSLNLLGAHSKLLYRLCSIKQGQPRLSGLGSFWHSQNYIVPLTPPNKTLWNSHKSRISGL